MPKALVHYLTSQYLTASRALYPKSRPRRIVAYVESYNDVSFWKDILEEFETPQLQFQVLLPGGDDLTRGKKVVLSSVLKSDQLGESLIACVDSDYDFLIQGANKTSSEMLGSPYVLQTYCYAIENFQCYAPGLMRACVTATLNDQEIFDIEPFLSQYSSLCYELFLWNVFFYKIHDLQTFPMNEFNRICALRDFQIANPSKSLDRLKRKVEAKLFELKRECPEYVAQVHEMGQELRRLGLRPETSYLYMQGHNVMDNVVMKILTPICQELRRRMEADIRHRAASKEQKENEIAGYQHSNLPVEAVLRKSQAYKELFLFEWIREDIKNMLSPKEDEEK